MSKNETATSLTPVKTLVEGKEALELLGDFLNKDTWDDYKKRLEKGLITITENESGGFTIRHVVVAREEEEKNQLNFGF